MRYLASQSQHITRIGLRRLSIAYLLTSSPECPGADHKGIYMAVHKRKYRNGKVDVYDVTGVRLVRKFKTQAEAEYFEWIQWIHRKRLKQQRRTTTRRMWSALNGEHC